MTTELKPCPFCKDGETNIRENCYSPTMSGNIKEPISVDITHWCKGDGFPRRRIVITGRTRQEAIEAWNTRTPEASKAAVPREVVMGVLKHALARTNQKGVTDFGMLSDMKHDVYHALALLSGKEG